MKMRLTSKAIIEHEKLMIMKNARIYISGKISGLADLNESKFSRTENWLRFKHGTDLQIINPHNLPHLHDKSWNSYMKEDLGYLLDCNMMVMLDDWQDSRGAIIEILVGQAVSIPAYTLLQGELQQVQIGSWLKAWLLIKLFLRLI